MTKEINELTNKSLPVETDEIAIQETGGGTTKKTTLADIKIAGKYYQYTSSLGTNSHAGISSGYQVKTNHFDNNEASGSGAVLEYTGTTTAGKAGNVPDADGYFYDADGKQFTNVSPVILANHWGVRTSETSSNNSTAIDAALAWAKAAKVYRIEVLEGTYSFNSTIDLSPTNYHTIDLVGRGGYYAPSVLEFDDGTDIGLLIQNSKQGHLANLEISTRNVTNAHIGVLCNGVWESHWEGITIAGPDATTAPDGVNDTFGLVLRPTVDGSVSSKSSAAVIESLKTANTGTNQGVYWNLFERVHVRGYVYGLTGYGGEGGSNPRTNQNQFNSCKINTNYHNITLDGIGGGNTFYSTTAEGANGDAVTVVSVSGGTGPVWIGGELGASGSQWKGPGFLLNATAGTSFPTANANGDTGTHMRFTDQGPQIYGDKLAGTDFLSDWVSQMDTLDTTLDIVTTSTTGGISHKTNINSSPDSGIRKINDDNAFLELYMDRSGANNDGRLNASDSIRIQPGGSIAAYFQDPSLDTILYSDLDPNTTETQDIGSASKEWDNIFLQNSATVSDEREKNDLGRISPEKAHEFLMALDPRWFSKKRKVVQQATEGYYDVRHKTELVSVDEQYVEVENGNAVLKTRVKEEKRTVFKNIPVVDEGGEPVLNPETGEQIIHREPVTERVWVEGQPEKIVEHGRPHTGLMAQKVKEAMTVCGIEDWAGYAYDEEADKHFLRLQEFIGILIAGYQNINK